jgi:hypothetical protein
LFNSRLDPLLAIHDLREMPRDAEAIEVLKQFRVGARFPRGN